MEILTYGSVITTFLFVERSCRMVNTVKGLRSSMDGYNYLILRNFAKVTRNNIKAHELHLTVYMYVQNSLALLFLETLMLFQ